ncbi:uncharacterized protein LOC142341143 [Convolutriloba macropyga]|uniref:uncharacterized protein LOC142341143 n=1 Tax=Convolutriloba macropyga TaxID=536237 RepID=UPI003F51EAC9
MKSEVRFCLILPSNLVVIVTEDEPTRLTLKKSLKPRFHQEKTNGGGAKVFKRSEFPINLAQPKSHSKSALNGDASIGDVTRGVSDDSSFICSSEEESVDLCSVIVAIKHKQSVKLGKVDNGSGVYSELQTSETSSDSSVHSTLFVLLERGVIIQYQVNTDLAENWLFNPHILISHLKPDGGWELMSAAIQFAPSSSANGSARQNTKAPRSESRSPNHHSFDLNTLDLEDNLDHALTLMSKLHDNSTDCDDILMIALCMRLLLENTTYETDDGGSIPVYDSQIVLHRFSMTESALVSSQILATEVLPCQMTFSKSYLICSFGTLDYFDKFITIQSLQTNNNNLQHYSQTNSYEEPKPASFIWTVDNGFMWSQGSLEMSTQTELSNILDIFDDQTIDNLTGIANVRANETSDCIFIIDKEKHLNLVDLRQNSKLCFMPSITIAHVQPNLRYWELHEKNRAILSYDSQVHFFEVTIPKPEKSRSASLSSQFHNKYNQEGDLHVTAEVINIPNCLVPECYAACYGSGVSLRGIRLVQTSTIDDNIGIVNCFVGQNGSKTLDTFDSDLTSKRTRTLFDRNEELNIDNLNWLTRRLEYELPTDELKSQLRGYVTRHPLLFKEAAEDEGTAADLEPTDLDDVLEMGLRNPQVQRYEADCDELHDDMADLGVQLRKLLFGSNYNLVARFFKLTEIEDEKPIELLQEICSLIGYNNLTTTNSSSTDNLTPTEQNATWPPTSDEETDQFQSSDDFKFTTIAVQDLQKLFVPEEDEIFSGRLRSKSDIAVLPIFELTCRLLVKELNQSEARKLIRFIVDSINNHKDVSLFHKVSEENFVKRLERITIEEEPSSNQQIDERQVKSGTERRRLFAKKSQSNKSAGEIGTRSLSDVIQTLSVNNSHHNGLLGMSRSSGNALSTMKIADLTQQSATGN